MDEPAKFPIGLSALFHSDAMWRRIRDHDRDGWEEAVTVDRAIRVGLRDIRGAVFVRSRPLQVEH